MTSEILVWYDRQPWEPRSGTRWCFVLFFKEQRIFFNFFFHSLLLSHLVSATLSSLDSSWLSCCCPVTLRSCRFVSAGLVSSRALEGHKLGGCWFWACVVAGLASSPALCCSHYQGELSCIALAGSPLTVKSKGWGWLSCFQLSHP